MLCANTIVAIVNSKSIVFLSIQLKLVLNIVKIEYAEPLIALEDTLDIVGIGQNTLKDVKEETPANTYMSDL